MGSFPSAHFIWGEVRYMTLKIMLDLDWFYLISMFIEWNIWLGFEEGILEGKIGMERRE